MKLPFSLPAIAGYFFSIWFCVEVMNASGMVHWQQNYRSKKKKKENNKWLVLNLWLKHTQKYNLCCTLPRVIPSFSQTWGGLHTWKVIRGAPALLGGLSLTYHSLVAPGSSITYSLANSEAQNTGWSRINPQFPLKQWRNLRPITNIKVSTAEPTPHWIGFLLICQFVLLSRRSIRGSSDRWMALSPQR